MAEETVGISAATSTESVSGEVSETTKKNIFQEIAHGAEVVAKDVAHVVVEVVEFPAKGIKVFETIKTDFPILKPALLKLVTDGEALAADTTAVIGADGLNVTLDLTEWNQLLVIKADLTAAIKEVEAAYAQINGDVA